MNCFLYLQWAGFFESFLQGITGFGVPVAVGAPLLIGIGVKPLWAVIIPLIGQAWGNTFGTLGAAWDSLAMSAGLAVGSSEYLTTAMWTAFFLFIWTAIGGFATCWFYGKGKCTEKRICSRSNYGSHSGRRRTSADTSKHNIGLFHPCSYFIGSHSSSWKNQKCIRTSGALRTARS